MYRFEGLVFFYRFHEQHPFFENSGTQLKAWQKTMTRAAERPFVSCKHGKAKRAKTRKKQANSADIGIFLRTGSRTPVRGQQTTPDGSGTGSGLIRAHAGRHPPPPPPPPGRGRPRARA